MQITFLGTGAATSYPLAFCRCAFCNEARRRGGKDLRKRCSVIINDDMIIDMGPDIMSASMMYGKSIVDIRYHLQTHPHSDHFDPQVFTTRAPEYLGVNMPPLQVCASEKTLKRMSEMVANEGYIDDFLKPEQQERMRLKVLAVEPLKSYEMGGYEVVPFSTDHDVSNGSLLYAVSQNHRTMFYGTDTDVLLEETWSGFHAKRMKFDAVILDHTYGSGAYNGGHLDAQRFAGQLQRMKEEHLLAENARVLATHIAHEGNPTHAEFSEYAAKIGYDVAYDGLVVEL
jgi:phosphoribosyl 1,2-cyclic phosphate phosphodiesterase